MSFLPVKFCEELLFGNKTQADNGLMMLKALAQMGHEGAHLQLGIHYQEGQFIPKNLNLARYHYDEATKMGSIAAARNLAILYQSSPVFHDDLPKFIALYEIAALGGDAIAAYNLGIVYQAGQGVIKDHYKAKTWYEKAVNLGHNKAKSRISELVLNKPEPTISATKKAQQKNLMPPSQTHKKDYETQPKPARVSSMKPKNFQQWLGRAKPNSLWERLKGQGHWR